MKVPLLLAFMFSQSSKTNDLENGTPSEKTAGKRPETDAEINAEINEDLNEDDDGNLEHSHTHDSSMDGETGDDTPQSLDEKKATLWVRFHTRCSKIKKTLFESFLGDNPDLECVPTYRWMPILSGIIIPFSILLEIPGLTEHWYVVTENNKTVFAQKNSALLDAGLGISMGCAVIANLAIIFRFLERHVRTSTLVAIAALTAHDCINIAAVTVFGVVHRFNDGFTYGQSFWFTVCSTIASTLTNISLIVDYFRTPNFALSGSGLTRKQRSLVIVVMVLLCWIGFGGLVNSLLMKLDFINGLYFTVVSIETIGFGDIAPETTDSRVFSGFHSTIGILNLAVCVGICRDTIIESFEHTYKKRINDLRERHRKRKARRAEVRAKKAAIKKLLEENGLPVYVSTHIGGGRGHAHRVHLNVDALTPQQKADAMREALEIAKHPKMSRKMTINSQFASSFDVDLAEDLQKDFVVKLSVVWVLFLLFWLVGSAIFMVTEKWSYGIALWFCFTAFSTIGYGDFTPVTPAGRAVFIVWALLGVGNMTILLSVLTDGYTSQYQKVLGVDSAVETDLIQDSTGPTQGVIVSQDYANPSSNSTIVEKRSSGHEPKEGESQLTHRQAVSSQDQE